MAVIATPTMTGHIELRWTGTHGDGSASAHRTTHSGGRTWISRTRDADDKLP